MNPQRIPIQLTSRNYAPRRCVWREDGNPDKPRCGVMIPVPKTPHQVTCGAHSIRWAYLSKKAKRALRDAGV